MTFTPRWIQRGLVLLAACLLSACGGGGGGSNPPPADPAPVIASQPSDAQVVVGADARFEATAQGAAITWTWQRSGDSGATWVAAGTPVTSSSGNSSTAFLNVTGVNLSADNSRYRAVASNTGGQVTTSAATLTVRSQVTPASISVQPAAQQTTEGGSVTFAVTAAGTALQYQWQSSLSSSPWANVAGATAPTLQLQGLAVGANGTQYRVVVSNSSNSVTSDVVSLTVTAVAAAPAFTLQPTAAAVTAPNTATFTVAVSGQPAPALQWQRSSNGGASYTDLPGATGVSYTTPATTLADNGAQVRVVATSSAGTATSQPATLTVGAELSLPVFTTQPQDVNVTVGQTATWTAAVSGVPTPTFQWQLSNDGGISFANINGATGSSYSLLTAVGDNGKRYRVVASNSQGTATSRAAVLGVTAPAAVSVLEGRAWTAGSRFNVGGENLFNVLRAGPPAAIDPAGRIHTAFQSINASTNARSIWVTTSLPGPSTARPAWGTPTRLLTSSATGDSLTSLTLDATGVAVVVWSEIVPCAQPSIFACSNRMHSRFDAATGGWTRGAVLPDAELALLSGVRNEVGDEIVLTRLDGANTLVWRQRGSTQIETLVLPETDVVNSTLNAAPVGVSLSSSGDFTVAYYSVDPRSDLIKMRRGSIRTRALGPLELTGSGSASSYNFVGVWTNATGQLVVLLSVGGRPKVATLENPSQGWSFADPSSDGPLLDVRATLTPNGDFFLYSFSGCRALRRFGGVWSGVTALATDLCGPALDRDANRPALSANGNVLAVDRLDGRWVTFDARRQELVRGLVASGSGPGPGYVLGTRWNSLPGTVLLSDSGVGAYVFVNSFDTLPTASVPDGVTGAATTRNIWGLYFK